mgnify:CR=1
MTLAEYLIITTGACCYYCQFPLPDAGVGLDRLDNSIGYTVANVVPCCTDCNYTRGHTWSHQEYLELAPMVRRLKIARSA